MVGAVGLHAVDLERSRAEIGYWTAPWARRAGRRDPRAAACSPAGPSIRPVWGCAGWSCTPSRRTTHPIASPSAPGFVQGDLVRGGIALRGRRRDVVRFVLQP